MKTTICILRHGETDWNMKGIFQGKADIELNETGRAQAKTVAQYLASHSWNSLASSPLKIAKETAEIIGKHADIPKIQVFDDIMERDFGLACGMEPQERSQRFPDGVFEGEEDFSSFSLRVMNGLNKIAEENHGKRTIVVAHGGVIDAVLTHLIPDKYTRLGMKLKNTCMSMLHKEGGNWVLEFYNMTAEELSSK